MKKTAAEILRKQYHGNRNFMTPHRIKVGKINPNMAYELSSGHFAGYILYGVTIVSIDSSGKTTPEHNLSKSFNSRSKALVYINELKRRKGIN